MTTLSDILSIKFKSEISLDAIRSVGTDGQASAALEIKSWLDAGFKAYCERHGIDPEAAAQTTGEARS